MTQTVEEVFGPQGQLLSIGEKRMATLEVTIEELQRKIREIEKRRGEAALKVLDGEAGFNGQDGARKAKQVLTNINAQLAEERQRLVELRAAYDTYRIQSDGFEAQKKTKDLKHAWDETARLSKQRVAAATEIRDLAKELSAKVTELTDLSTQMHDAAPRGMNKNLGFTDLSPASITESVRIQLHKAGFLWAFSLPFGKDSVPSLIQKVTTSNRQILSHRS
jgi:hypothetical protein